MWFYKKFEVQVCEGYVGQVGEVVWHHRYDEQNHVEDNRMAGFREAQHSKGTWSEINRSVLYCANFGRIQNFRGMTSTLCELLG